MKAFLLILSLMSSYGLAQSQGNPQPAQPGAIPSTQKPAQQQPAPAGQPAGSMPQQGAPAGQKSGTGAPPQGAGNVASTLHVYAYPKGNQPPDKQSKDETECYQSAQGPATDQGQPTAQQGQSGQAGKGATVKG